MFLLPDNGHTGESHFVHPIQMVDQETRKERENFFKLRECISDGWKNSPAQSIKKVRMFNRDISIQRCCALNRKDGNWNEFHLLLLLISSLPWLVLFIYLFFFFPKWRHQIQQRHYRSKWVTGIWAMRLIQFLLVNSVKTQKGVFEPILQRE